MHSCRHAFLAQGGQRQWNAKCPVPDILLSLHPHSSISSGGLVVCGYVLYVYNFILLRSVYFIKIT